MKGKKIRLTSDATLAQEHAAGATVSVVLPALHQRYGSVHIVAPIYDSLHYGLWQSAHKTLANLDQEILRLPIGPANVRTIGHFALTRRLYEAGMAVVVNSVLTVHHITLRLERATKLKQGRNVGLTERFKVALTAVGFRDIATDARYNRLVELHKYRDLMMHPADENLFAPPDEKWANVPLAWFASGRALEASLAAATLVDEIATYWSKASVGYREDITLTVARGIKSLEPAKKPPS